VQCAAHYAVVASLPPSASAWSVTLVFLDYSFEILEIIKRAIVWDLRYRVAKKHPSAPKGWSRNSRWIRYDTIR